MPHRVQAAPRSVPDPSLVQKGECQLSAAAHVRSQNPGHPRSDRRVRCCLTCRLTARQVTPAHDQGCGRLSAPEFGQSLEPFLST